MTIFEFAMADTGGRWLADDDGLPICVQHLAKGCRTCEPPAPATVGGGLVGAAEQTGRIPPGAILSVGVGEPIASRVLSADGTWLFDLATGDHACVAHLRRLCTQGCPPMPAGEMVAAGGRWAQVDHDEITDWEPPPGHIPKVDCAEQVPAAVAFAQVHPESRWYVEKRARALGFGEAIPRGWAATAVAAAAPDPEPVPGPHRAQLQRRVVRRISRREELYRRVHGRASDGGR